ncbi:MAG TPA: CaiB/BaiF CoA-transferase family protein [Candidatus Dormibacteraeota bacterium]|nr:CaiB/BaiF CoA-transferase family protein [Candidatus Dormibacteraeota bacterium]
MTLPLEGLTVLGLEQAVAAPFATRQLADLGARVIKVERPEGGDFARGYESSVLGQSGYFVWLNRSKESLALDLKSPRGRDVIERLLPRLDVLVQNLGPGATARLGLDAASLRRRFPRLIVCDISGYGGDGPWAQRKAYDLLVQCETALVALTGSPQGVAKVGISVADIAAGMYAFTGILTALYERARHGEGAHVEVSLFEALAEWMGAPAYYTRYSGRQPERSGAQHATIAPYGPVPVGDGGTVVIAVQTQVEWTAFCTRVLGDPSLAGDERFLTNPARVANRAELSDIIARRFAALTTPEVLELLDSAGLASARVNSVAQFLDHPVLRERDRWREVQTPGGPVDALLPPATPRGREARMDPVPALGEHTESILRELGLADAGSVA